MARRSASLGNANWVSLGAGKTVDEDALVDAEVDDGQGHERVGLGRKSGERRGGRGTARRLSGGESREGLESPEGRRRNALEREERRGEPFLLVWGGAARLIYCQT